VGAVRLAWRNWIARATSNRKVKGSSPFVSGVFVIFFARLAQSVERTTLNRVVVGSSPTSGVLNRANSLVV
jgi:hypothetical protein